MSAAGGISCTHCGMPILGDHCAVDDKPYHWHCPGSLGAMSIRAMEASIAAEAKDADPVENPAHYTAGAIECIDAIEAALGRGAFIGYLRGQVLKYTWRIGLNGDAAEDAGKARWYAARLEALLKGAKP